MPAVCAAAQAPDRRTRPCRACRAGRRRLRQRPAMRLRAGLPLGAHGMALRAQDRPAAAPPGGAPAHLQLRELCQHGVRRGRQLTRPRRVAQHQRAAAACALVAAGAAGARVAAARAARAGAPRRARRGPGGQPVCRGAAARVAGAARAGRSRLGARRARGAAAPARRPASARGAGRRGAPAAAAPRRARGGALGGAAGRRVPLLAGLAWSGALLSISRWRACGDRCDRPRRARAHGDGLSLREPQLRQRSVGRAGGRPAGSGAGRASKARRRRSCGVRGSRACCRAGPRRDCGRRCGSRARLCGGAAPARRGRPRLWGFWAGAGAGFRAGAARPAERAGGPPRGRGRADARDSARGGARASGVGGRGQGRRRVWRGVL